MKHYCIFILAALLCVVAQGQEGQRQRLESHVRALDPFMKSNAKDSLAEYITSNAKDSLAEYITAQWKAMGLKGLWSEDYRMEFGKDDGHCPCLGNRYCNLVAVIEGSDSTLKNEYIVLGAHYDYEDHSGIDDNASGVACLTEVARQLLQQQGTLKRSVIICALDKRYRETIPSYRGWGANLLLKRLGAKQVKLMVNVERVAQYSKNGSLILEGTGTIAKGELPTDPSILGVDIKVKTKRFERRRYNVTNTVPFARGGVPTLSVRTSYGGAGYDDDTVAVEDVDYEGLGRVADYVAALATAASGILPLQASGRISRLQRNMPEMFQLGLTVGLNTSRLRFPDASFKSKIYGGFVGGLVLKYTPCPLLAIRADVDYSYTCSAVPDASDVFHKCFWLNQYSINVPLIIQFAPVGHDYGISYGLGGFYSHVFAGGVEQMQTPISVPGYKYNRDLGGVVLNLECVAGPLIFDFSYWIFCGNAFDTSNGIPPECHKNMFTFSLGYML